MTLIPPLWGYRRQRQDSLQNLAYILAITLYMTGTARDLVSKKAEGDDHCTGLSSGIDVSDMAHRCPHTTQEQKSTECTNDDKGGGRI